MFLPQLVKSMQQDAAPVAAAAARALCDLALRWGPRAVDDVAARRTSEDQDRESGHPGRSAGGASAACPARSAAGDKGNS